LGFLGSGNLSRLVSEAFEVGWSEDFRFGGHKSSVFGSDLGYSRSDSWLLALHRRFHSGSCRNQRGRVRSWEQVLSEDLRWHSDLGYLSRVLGCS